MLKTILKFPKVRQLFPVINQFKNISEIPKIKRVVIRGERCSGTNYIKSLIKNNFKTIQTSDIELGWKHSYLNMDNPNISKNHEYLVVIIFRNPLNWIRSFYNKPYHMKLGNKIKSKKISLSQFLRDKLDEVDFSFSRCPFHHKPWSGYDGIKHIPPPRILRLTRMELRNSKNADYLKYPNIFKNLIFIKYEDLVLNYDNILREINEKWIHEPNKKYENVVYWKGLKRYGLFKPKTYQKMSKDDFDFMLNELDWNLENKIGYTKESMIEKYNKENNSC